MLQQLCLWALGKTGSGLLISDVIVFMYVYHFLQKRKTDVIVVLFMLFVESLSNINRKILSVRMSLFF